MKIVLMLINFIVIASFFGIVAADADQCQSYSPRETDSYWWVDRVYIVSFLSSVTASNSSVYYQYRDAVARCNECSSIEGCGFCESSLQCISGDSSGPTGATVCASWVFDNTMCPGMLFFLPSQFDALQSQK